jgi:glutamate-5-semialdehyde dehydrogenase
VNDSTNLHALMQPLGRDAVAAQRVLAVATAEQRNRALLAMSTALRLREAAVLEANARDMDAATAAGLNAAGLDRLRLDAARLAGIARGLEEIAALECWLSLPPRSIDAFADLRHSAPASAVTFGRLS